MVRLSHLLRRLLVNFELYNTRFTRTRFAFGSPARQPVIRLPATGWILFTRGQFETDTNSCFRLASSTNAKKYEKNPTHPEKTRPTGARVDVRTRSYNYGLCVRCKLEYSRATNDSYPVAGSMCEGSSYIQPYIFEPGDRCGVGKPDTCENGVTVSCRTGQFRVKLKLWN